MKESGILRRKGKRYLFIKHYDLPFKYLAWDIDDSSHKTPRQRWKKLPKGEIELFDTDNPPKTVKYITLLAPFE